MGQNVTIAGAQYVDVPYIDVPKTGTQTDARFIDEESIPVFEKDICFWDYDGTLIDSWDLSELQSKTELPEGPTNHPALTFVEWNWTLQELKDQNTKMEVGACYDTVSGLSEFDIELNAGTGLVVPLKMVGLKDWGDGTAQNSLLTHTYTDYGKYTITVDGTEIPAGTSTDTKSGIIGSTGDNAYSWIIKEIRLSSNVTVINNYGLPNISSLERLSLSTSITSAGTAWMNYTRNLDVLIVPRTCSSLGSARYAYGIQRFCYPRTFNSAAGYLFGDARTAKRCLLSRSMTGSFAGMAANAYSATHFIIPDAIVSIPGSIVNADVQLKRIDIYGAVTTVSSSAFASGTALEVITMLNCTAVPSLSDTNAFTSTPRTLKVVVPDDLYDAWIVKTNWKTAAIAARIISESNWRAQGGS